MVSAGLPPLFSPPPRACSGGRLCRGTVYNRRENGTFAQHNHFMWLWQQCLQRLWKIPSSELIWDFLEERLGKADVYEVPVTSRPVSSWRIRAGDKHQWFWGRSCRNEQSLSCFCCSIISQGKCFTSLVWVKPAVLFGVRCLWSTFLRRRPEDCSPWFWDVYVFFFFFQVNFSTLILSSFKPFSSSQGRHTNIFQLYPYSAFPCMCICVSV